MPLGREFTDLKSAAPQLIVVKVGLSGVAVAPHAGPARRLDKSTMSRHRVIQQDRRTDQQKPLTECCVTTITRRRTLSTHRKSQTLNMSQSSRKTVHVHEQF